MAMLNEILGVAARFNQHLTRKFGVTGGAPSPQLTPEIQPVYQLEAGPEAHILQSEYMATGIQNVAAVAAKKTASGLFNPSGSNIVVVVSHIECTPAALSQVVAGIVRTTPYPIVPSPGNVCYRDTRMPIDPGGSTTTRPPTALVRGDNDPPTLPTPNVFYRNIAAATTTEYNGDIVLAPGWAVAMYLGAVNTQAYFGFAWNEIPLAHGEVGPF